MLRKSFIIFGALLIICSLFTTLYAQEGDGKLTKIKERVIYIPYYKLESLAPEKDRGIYLPYKDYQELINKLEKLQTKPVQLPSQVVITNVNYKAKVVNDLVKVNAIFELNVLKTGWHRLALNFRNIAIKQALLDKEPALIRLKNDGYELIFKNNGVRNRKLNIDFMVPINKTNELNAVVNFNIPRSPIANLTLEIPGKKKIKVNIKPSLSTSINVTDKATKVEALLGNTDRININWQLQAERKLELQNIVHAENISFLGIEENFLRLQSQINYDLIQGKIKQLRVKIPENFRIFSVRTLKGAGIQDWNLNKEGILVVNLHEAFDNDKGKVDLILKLKLEKVIKKLESKLTLPVCKVLDVEREKGYTTIAVNELYTLKIVERNEISQIDVNDLPAYVSKNNVQFAFRYLKQPFSLQLEVEKKKPVYTVITNIAAYMDKTLLKVHSCLLYEIKKSRIFDTKIQIPGNFRLLDVNAYDLVLPKSWQRRQNKIKEYHKITEGNKNFLVITFKKGIKTEQLVLKLHLQRKLDKVMDVRTIDLPVFKVLGAKRETGNFGIGVKSCFNITTIDKESKNIFPIDIRKLFKTGIRPSINKFNIGFRYFDHPINGKFKIEKRKPLVIAEVYNYISTTDNIYRSEFNIFYNVKYTGIKKFQFSLPEDIAKKVTKSRIDDTKGIIKEINIVPVKKDKSMLYTIVTQREILGEYQVKVIYEKELGDIKDVKLQKIFELKTQNTESEHGFIVFKKNNNLSIDFVAAKGLEVTDINDSTFAKGSKKDILTIFKYARHGFELTMRLKKLSFASVLNTVINRLHISTTVNKDFTCKNEAVVALINNKMQMLEFEIPKNSTVTSVARVKSLPSVQYGQRLKAYEINRYLESLNWSKSDRNRCFKVNIATNVKKNAPFILVIKYESRVKEGTMDFYGDFTIKPINFLEVPVTHFTWTTGLPNEFQYVWFKSDLMKNFTQDYGTWEALAEILNRGGLNTTSIRQNAETGVIPIYPIQGKRFSFYKFNSGGYINISYMYNNWLYTLELLFFIVTCVLIVLIPKLRLIKRLTLVFVFAIISIVLSSLNLQGFSDIYLTILVATCVCGVFAFIIYFLNLVGIKLISQPTPHKLYKGIEEDAYKANIETKRLTQHTTTKKDTGKRYKKDIQNETKQDTDKN